MGENVFKHKKNKKQEREREKKKKEKHKKNTCQNEINTLKQHTKAKNQAKQANGLHNVHYVNRFSKMAYQSHKHKVQNPKPEKSTPNTCQLTP